MDCKDILSGFRDLKDLCGQVQTLPNPSPKVETALTNNKRHYLDRVSKHLHRAFTLETCEKTSDRYYNGQMSSHKFLV